ncbi:hypothetical protein NM208_g5601 [Fusarium decemcellulare]|uniref:Uncharacterized protein n=1 Tax=Fusarium decemcellulare TaxID=57161 RepID=A0ACC1SGJ1_9HYPO|nr:hypothetical protein NM208_g5601 [Fusarium decemcellulare]
MSSTTSTTPLTVDVYVASASSLSVSTDTTPVSSPNTSAPAVDVPGMTDMANPRCQCSCVCYKIVRRRDCVFCDFCIENHLGPDQRSN